MFGFVELFVAWVVLAVWAAVLAGRPGAPGRTTTVAWATGLLLGLCLAVAFYGLFAAITSGGPAADPSEPSRPPADSALRYALYGAHAVLVLGYLAMIGITARWLVRRGA